MKERPILFSAPMVRALLAGTKTVTRRVLKSMPAYTPGPLVHRPTHPAQYFDAYCGAIKTAENPRGMSGDWCWWSADDRPAPDTTIKCPFGVPGDRLWVRETFCVASDDQDVHVDGEPESWRPRGLMAQWAYYRATDQDVIDINDPDGKRSPWKPSIFMPRWASRITLEITGVRVERLHDITDEDARAEGVSGGSLTGPVEAFEYLWCDINGAASWTANPWVWAVSFKRVEVTP